MKPEGLLIVLAGIFSIVAAMSDWGWYWNSWKAARLVSFIGKPAARIAYCILGLCITIAGIVLTINAY